MKEKYQIRSQGSNLTKYLAEQESMNTGRSFFGCVFHFFDASYHPTTKDEIIILLQKLAAKENDKCISKDLLETLIFMIRNQVQIFQQTIPYSVADRSSEMPIRIIICEL